MSGGQRSRDGCWTCKRRRKKCDATEFPCGNCLRLGLECDTETKLVWEDDARREGMRRRGPPKTKGSDASRDPNPTRTNQQETNNSIRLHRMSQWPMQLGETERRLLDRYIQRFSRVYPAFSGDENPFLRVILPLCMQSQAVLSAALALSGVQSWENGEFSQERAMLRLRHQALTGCAEMVNKMVTQNNVQDQLQYSSNIADAAQTIANSAPNEGESIANLWATCGLLLLYEKLRGESQENGSIHLQFFARLFPIHLYAPSIDKAAGNMSGFRWDAAMQFLSTLFLYNDLIRSTSLRTETLSSFYLYGGPYSPDALSPSGVINPGRFGYPNIIARISAGDTGVTDAEIACWDGRLDWFPSTALLPPQVIEPYERLPTSHPAFVHDTYYRHLESFAQPRRWPEGNIASELYRIAATVYRKQHAMQIQLQDLSGGIFLSDEDDARMGNLPQWAIELIQLIPSTSPLLNVLLWPIGIIAKELTSEDQRGYIISRLRSLERQFNMRHFSATREHLVTLWQMRDQGKFLEEKQYVMFG